VSEEKDRILKLLEEKKITADEAARLLDAISEAGSGEYQNRFLKVKVWEGGSDKAKVNITLPISLVRVGLKMASEHDKAKIAGADVDLRQVSEALDRGITGKIIEVDDESGKHVEVWLE
jgi:hypothetical protein